MKMKKMTDLDLKNKTVLIREDLNVPMKNGAVANDNRIRASLPTIQAALDGGAGVILMSHLGRPTEGEKDEKYSLEPVARHIAKLLGKPVRFESEYLDVPVTVKPGEVVLLEMSASTRAKRRTILNWAKNWLTWRMCTSWMPLPQRTVPIPAPQPQPSLQKKQLPGRSW